MFVMTNFNTVQHKKGGDDLMWLNKNEFWLVLLGWVIVTGLYIILT